DDPRPRPPDRPGVLGPGHRTRGGGGAGAAGQRGQRADRRAAVARPGVPRGALRRRRAEPGVAVGGLRRVRGGVAHRHLRRRPRAPVGARHRLRQDRRPHRRQGAHRRRARGAVDARRAGVVDHPHHRRTRTGRDPAAVLGAAPRRDPRQPRRQDQDGGADPRPGPRDHAAARGPAARGGRADGGRGRGHGRHRRRLPRAGPAPALPGARRRL
ncbi:MAG: CDP-diacylglycerol--glycerol-3-phosphate 3-phosphatidyltransferase, partial [uncultured Actinomycetospora sp.]